MAPVFKQWTAAARLDQVSKQVQGNSTSTAMAAELEQKLAQRVKEGKIPHCIVFATNKDASFKYSHAVGYQHCSINDEPIQKDSVLMLASQTKLLTAISALKIVEQGLIGLDDDISAHLPELGKQKIIQGLDDEGNPILKPRQNPITLRQLCLHTSGVAYSFTPELLKHNALRGVTLDSPNLPTIVERFDVPLVFEPGTSWIYGPGLDWAGLLIQRLSGIELEEYFQKHLFKPLGITGITYWPQKHPELKDKIPQLVVRGSDGSLKPNRKQTLNTNSTDCFGGHGCFAKLGDYLEVQRSLLANDGRLLTASSVDELFRPDTAGAPGKALNEFRTQMGWSLIGEFEDNIDVAYAIGGMVFLEGDKGRRRKGTLSWGGVVNPYWLIDREAGLALTVGFQVLPPGDAGCKEATGLAEKAIYKMAGLA